MTRSLPKLPPALSRPLLLGALALALAFGSTSEADGPSVVAAPVASLDPLLQPLTEDRLFRDATVGLQVVDVETGQEVFSHNADLAMLPASTMKVVTAAAALRTLGPSYTWSTTLLTDGQIQPDGVLEGNLYVRGTGDPTFVVEKLWKLLYDLKLEGVTEIKGDIIFDRSFMDDVYSIPGWTKEEDVEDGPSYFPTLGALSINYNTAAVVVGPGAVVGQGARAVLETGAPGIVEIESKLVTSSRGSRRNIRMEREVEGSKMKLKLSGTVPLGSEAQRFYRAVPDPSAHYTAAFAAMVKQHNLKVSGRYLDGATPPGAHQLVELRSPALSVVLMDTNKHSNNFMAEQVLKTLGAETRGLPGTTEGGLSVVADYLKAVGVPTEEFKLVNGSGLSREFKLRPSHLDAVLVDMAHDHHVGAEFQASLAIGGRDGTLWARFREEDEIDRVRGKTGTLNGVHCLAGYVEAADGRMYAFAFLVNDLPYSISRARRVHDQFVEIMFGVDSAAVAEGQP